MLVLQTSGAIDINSTGNGTVNIAGALITTGATNANNDGSDAGLVTIDTATGTLTVPSLQMAELAPSVVLVMLVMQRTSH